MAFEGKEHLGVCVLVLAVGGLGLALRGAERPASTCYRLAAGLAWAVVGIGWVVTAKGG